LSVANNLLGKDGTSNTTMLGLSNDLAVEKLGTTTTGGAASTTPSCAGIHGAINAHNGCIDIIVVKASPLGDGTVNWARLCIASSKLAQGRALAIE